MKGLYFNVLEKRQTNNNKLRGGWQEGVKGAPRMPWSEEGPVRSVRVDLENQAEQGKENCKKNEQILKNGIR